MAGNWENKTKQQQKTPEVWAEDMRLIKTLSKNAKNSDLKVVLVNFLSL